MSSQERTALLVVIWFSMGMAAIGIGAESSQPELIVIPIAVALLVTVALVMLPDLPAALASRGKAKRQPQDRLSLLLEIMDEDERAAFKETLKRRMLADMDHAQDGELPAHDTTLAALLDEDRGHTHRSR